jgi:hypothetical protein
MAKIILEKQIPENVSEAISNTLLLKVFGAGSIMMTGDQWYSIYNNVVSDINNDSDKMQKKAAVKDADLFLHILLPRPIIHKVSKPEYAFYYRIIKETLLEQEKPSNKITHLFGFDLCAINGVHGENKIEPITTELYKNLVPENDLSNGLTNYAGVARIALCAIDHMKSPESHKAIIDAAKVEGGLKWLGFHNSNENTWIGNQTLKLIPFKKDFKSRIASPEAFEKLYNSFVERFSKELVLNVNEQDVKISEK